MKIAKSLTELIGNTPLLELERYCKHYDIASKVVAKLEYLNPGGSIKDRVGYAMILDAEQRGLLSEGALLIEPTSGNTGIALALVAASRGYRLILTMPDSMSIERRKLLQALGAEVVLTPAAEGMQGAILKAEQLAKQHPNSFIPQQFQKPANARVHQETTAKEIWRDTDGQVKILVAGVGTGGTVAGIGRALKEKNADIKVFAVEPDASPVLSGGSPGPHKLQGIGAGFVPELYEQELVDGLIRVKSKEAYAAARALARTEGLLVGISSGAALFAAGEVSRRLGSHGGMIVVILPDAGERYLSTELWN